MSRSFTVQSLFPRAAHRQGRLLCRLGYSPVISFALGRYLLEPQAGVTHGDLYAFADENNILLPGGGHKTVGAGGAYVQVRSVMPSSDVMYLIHDLS